MKHSIKRKINPLTQSNRPRLRQGLATSKRKQWGNTLVPVVIGIAIASVATVSFLNQGAELTSKSKTINASTEIVGVLTDWVLATAAAGSTALTTNNAPTSLTARNIYEQQTSFAASAGTNSTYTYPTDSTSSCTTLRAIFTDSVDGVILSTCSGTDSVNLVITLSGPQTAAAN